MLSYITSYVSLHYSEGEVSITRPPTRPSLRHTLRFTVLRPSSSTDVKKKRGKGDALLGALVNFFSESREVIEAFMRVIGGGRCTPNRTFCYVAHRIILHYLFIIQYYYFTWFHPFIIFITYFSSIYYSFIIIYFCSTLFIYVYFLYETQYNL